jgi:hypothetical protein
MACYAAHCSIITVVPLRAAWLHVIIINMDTERRNKLVEKLKGQDPMPLVSLEEFFIGNDDEASIGCNLKRHPGMNIFYETLKEIRSKPNVQDVLVEITDLMEDDVEMWPFSDTVYILADATQKEVEAWLKKLHPDEAPEGDVDNRVSETVKLQPGMKMFVAWWD